MFGKSSDVTNECNVFKNYCLRKWELKMIRKLCSLSLSHCSNMLFLVTCAFFCQVIPYGTASPAICGEETVVTKSGDDFSLTCVGDSELRWEWPEYDTAEATVTPKWGDGGSTCATLNIANGEKSGTIKQISEITIHKIEFYATGNFTCIDGANSTANAYVFVSDEENLLAMKDGHPEIITAHQYDDVIIPCRPTAPDVHVSLTNMHGVMEFAPGDYDPKFGFKLYNLTLKDTSHLFCHAKRNEDDEGEEMYFELEVHDNRNEVISPRISGDSDLAVGVGQNATLICLADNPTRLHFEFKWIGPKSNEISGVTNSLADNKVTWASRIVVHDAARDDDGNYTCKIYRRDAKETIVTQELRVYNPNESFLNVTMEKHDIDVDLEIGKHAQWAGEVTSFPRANLTLISPEGLIIKENEKFSIKFRQKQRFSLEIRTCDIRDAGTYKLLASNGRDSQSHNLTLKVYSKPEVLPITGGPFYEYLKEVTIDCVVLANPAPSIEWLVKQCDPLDDVECANAEETLIERQSGLITEEELKNELVSHLKWKMMFPGEVVCRANNSKGNDSESVTLKVTDVPKGYKMDAPREVAVNDNVTVECAFTTYEFADHIDWFFRDSSDDDPVQLNNDTDVVVTSWSGNYSVHGAVRFVADKSKEGKYTCEATRRQRKNETTEKLPQTAYIIILDEEPAEIVGTDMKGSEMEISMWPVQLHCFVTGMPRPSITWYKDDQLLNISNDTSIQLYDDNQTLQINHIAQQDVGKKYECRASNRKGYSEAFTILRIKEGAPLTLIISVVVVAALLLIVLIILCVRVYLERKRKRELRLVGLLDFQQGGVGNINSELTIDEQANLLPYDKKWEFPINKLRLDKQLGAGAFGVVYKAEAEGIVPNEPRTTVAVKMVKRHSEPAHIRALAGELKIMAHLGRHANVVNLLGACTSQLAKRELLVIVEFCKFGNLHTYLLQNRSRFLDQIDPLTCEIDVTKGRIVGYARSRIQYAKLQFDRSVDSAQNTGVSFDTESTLVSTQAPEEDAALVNPVGGDYVLSEGEVLSTSVLVAWSFQIARGMEYLSSRRILHGDLAARNILLAEGNIVKICDFGLARSIYEGLEYRKAGKSLLPVKWLALESIQDRIFSTQSDVWSFGVVLWELFSLGRTPYPGIYSFEDVLEKLRSGYRLEQPDYATKTLYNVMLECWNAEPGKRPSFTDLACRLGILMEDSVRENYMDLNEQYKSNKEIPDTDYLAMVRAPTFENATAPHYVNIPQKPPGYLDMTSNKSSWGSDVDAYEMKPMLGRTPSDAENGDYLIPRDTPFPTTAVSNPSYHLRPPIVADTNEKTNSTDNLPMKKPTTNEPKQNNLYGQITKSREIEDLDYLVRHPVKGHVKYFEKLKNKDDSRK